MSDLQTTLKVYTDAWSEPDANNRALLLEKCWAENGIYEDPTGRAEGRNALGAYIGETMQRFRGMSIELTSGIDHHHDVFRFSWRLKLGDGSVLVEGIDFGALNPDGKLSQITGFFGPLPDIA